VVAMGSPFGEAQSLSTGVISATGRSIDSLTGFQISGALQTDAAINHGNSGGPLLNAAGQVLGINSQIASSSGGGEGVGFSVPVDTVRASLDQLRRTGHVHYAYLGISTTGVFPQLASRFGLPVSKGAYVQSVKRGSPAAAAGLRAGGRIVYFEAQDYRIGGDVITQVASYQVTTDTDLAQALSHFLPGATVSMQIWRGGSHQTVSVKLGERPVNSAP
jgi:S1-C subfamily serine protease